MGEKKNNAANVAEQEEAAIKENCVEIIAL
jgi:hypothetical protein